MLLFNAGRYPTYGTYVQCCANIKIVNNYLVVWLERVAKDGNNIAQSEENGPDPGDPQTNI